MCKKKNKKIKKKCTSKYEYDICARRKISKFQNKKKCTSKYAPAFSPQTNPTTTTYLLV